MSLDIYTDGACTIGANGGWSVVIPNNKKIMSGGALDTTNNEMELFAIYIALDYCLKRHIKDVNIYTDSGYSIGVFTEWAPKWKANSWKKKGGIKNLKLIRNAYKTLEALNSYTSVSFHKVKGHSGDKYNEMADYIAVEAKNEINNPDCVVKDSYILKKGDDYRYIFIY